MPAVWNGYFWDDHLVLEMQLPAIEGPSGAFFPPFRLPQWSAAYYRPLVTVSLLADAAIWGSRPFGYHLTVLALHALSCGLVFLLANLLYGEGAGGSGRRPVMIGTLAATLVFVLHPVHAEAVAWISGRADILASLFTVLALVCALSFGGDGGQSDVVGAGSELGGGEENARRRRVSGGEISGRGTIPGGGVPGGPWRRLGSRALEPANTEALLLAGDLALDLGDRPHAALRFQEAVRYLPEGERKRLALETLRSLGGDAPGVAPRP